MTAPPIVRSARVSWLTHPPHGRAHVSVGGRAFTELAMSLAAEEPQPQVTTPGELLTAAHAGAFAVVLSRILESDRTPVRELTVEARCSFAGDWYRMEHVRFTVRTRVDGVDAARLAQATRDTVEHLRESLGLPAEQAVEVDAALE